MIPIRVVAIPTEIADAVRRTHKDPHYGHPAHTEIAGEGAPCRHCLQIIAAGSENATLFTYDAFEGIESLPLPGPVYIHAEACERYPETRRISRRAAQEPANSKRLRTRAAVTRNGVRRGRQRGRRDRKALRTPRCGLHPRAQHHRRLLHVSHRTRGSSRAEFKQGSVSNQSAQVFAALAAKK